MKSKKPTKREMVFTLILMSLCMLVGSAIANSLYWLFSGGMSPLLVNLLFGLYFAAGALYFVRPDPTDMRSVIQGLRTSAIWPYLTWKKLETTYATPTGLTSKVYVNDVAVGEISDIDWSAIKLQVLRDPRVYLAQAMNVLRMCIVVLENLMWMVPLLAFWFTVYLAVFLPEEYSTMFGALQQDPASLASSIRIFAGVCGSVFLLLFPIFLPFGYRFGYVNHFARSRVQLARKLLKIAADGHVEIDNWVEVRAPREYQRKA